MKKILVGFLALTCLLLSASARLPLLHQPCFDNSGYHNSNDKQTNDAAAKSFFGERLSSKGKYFRRFFSLGYGYHVSNITKIVCAWRFIGFLVCLSALFFSIDLLSVCPRSPPVKLRY
jgi:hypothetical protein